MYFYSNHIYNNDDVNSNALDTLVGVYDCENSRNVHLHKER